MQKIYFPTFPLLLSNTLPPGYNGELINSLDKETLQAAIKDGNHLAGKELLYIQNDIEKAIETIKKEFTVIQAAGGLAYTPDQEVLLIFRRGKWDLPKGKLDEGETMETCAVREVEEETGLQNIELGELIQKTYHTYKENGNDVLKETFWYYMKAPKQDLHPQTDEDIDECRWVSKQELTSYFANMQPSVIDVLETFLRK
jgi:8-oxo-dGTP pyrophosphatase MutT (NUDIX family)